MHIKYTSNMATWFWAQFNHIINERILHENPNSTDELQKSMSAKSSW